MLKLKFQYFGHLMWRTDSLEKTLMLGNIEGRERSGSQKRRWLHGITNSMDMSRREWRTGKPSVLQSTGLQSQTQPSDWTTKRRIRCGTSILWTTTQQEKEQATDTPKAMHEGVKQARHRASWVTPFTGRPRFTAFRRCCSFDKLKVCGNPAPSKSPGTSFPTAFASFVFLCPVVVILTVFQIFHYYYIWWSAVSNLWCYYCKFFVLYYSFLETLFFIFGCAGSLLLCTGFL